MFKIGDFARIAQVAVSAVRYYDEVGLLKPRHVDRFTGYRYYSIEQLPALNRILALKDLGFSLEQIASLLDEELPVSDMRAMLTLRRADLQQSIKEAQDRLNRVEVRLRQIEMEGKMPGYEVIVKRVEPLLVMSASSTVEDRRLQKLSGAMAAEGELVKIIGEHCDRMAAKVREYTEQPGVKCLGPWILVYGQDGDDIALEMAAPVDLTTKQRTRTGLRELPGYDAVASVIHHGPYATIMQAYSAVGGWIESSGYSVCGPCREIYVHHDGDNLDNCLTEVQFPIERIK